MTALARRRAFLACAAALAGAAALVAVLNPTPSRDRAESAARHRPIIVDRDGSNSGPPRRDGADARANDRDVLPSARRRALAFVRAFLRYQIGDTSPRTRSALAKTASTAVTRYLVANPARSIGNAPHAEFRSMRLYGRGRSEVKASALLRYGRSRSLFEFRLRRGRGGWRVAEIYR